jgi:circadian clock protein KaiB
MKKVVRTDPPRDQQYVLRLYVAGVTPRSVQAIATIKRICEENLTGRYELEVIDIHQQPALAKLDQIIALPTLIRKLPEPPRILIGDMSNEQRVLISLDLWPHAARPPAHSRAGAPHDPLLNALPERKHAQSRQDDSDPAA